MLPPATPGLTALDLLDSVAELGSLGQAAARHGMSQPAVSMRMRQLEKLLGLRLLQRTPAGTRLTPAGTRLTPAGERVAALSRRVLAEAGALMTGVALLVAEETSHLRVAASRSPRHNSRLGVHNPGRASGISARTIPWCRGWF
jgi:molybdate transport repressor ModE-like protein